jgi:hypothetical protein
MQQVKLFKSVEVEVSALEADVNRWITQSGARIISVTGNIAPQSGEASSMGDGRGLVPSDILLIIVYDDGKPSTGT